MISLLLFKHAKVDYWKICPSVRVFTCGNNSHEVSQWLSENYPGREREASVFCPARSSDFNLFDFYFWGNFKPTASARTFDTREELWRRIEQFGTEIKDTPRNLRTLVSFFFHAELNWVVCELGGSFEHLSKESKKGKVISILLVFFLLIHKPLNLGGILKVIMCKI
jgi:hypothetical protein